MPYNLIRIFYAKGGIRMNGINKEVLSDREISLILKLSNKFNIPPKTAFKMNGNYYICDNNNYVYKVNRVSKDRGSFINELKVVQLFRENNIFNTITPIKAKNGDYFFKNHKNYYYITLFENEEKFTYEKAAHTKYLISNTAEIHNATIKIANDKLYKLGVKKEVLSYKNIMTQDVLLLEKIPFIVSKRNIISRFDDLVLGCLDYYTKLGVIGYSKIQDLDFQRLIEDNSGISRVVCLNRFNEKKITVSRNRVIFNDLKKVSCGVRSIDLYQLILELLKASESKEYLNKSIWVINEYNKYHKLTLEEVKLIFSLLVFPTKFCKLIRNRYEEKKDWEEEKYLSKLKRVISYSQRSNKFIRGYMKFISEYKY